MAGNAGISDDSIVSSAEPHVLETLSAADGVSGARTLDSSLSQQLDIEINKLKDMVRNLETLERALEERRQNTQTTMLNEQTIGLIDRQVM